MSRILRAAAALGTAALCFSLAACANSSGGGNVASVNGQAISRADLDRKLESSAAAKQVLSQMVQQTLLDQYARDKKVDVTQAEIDKRETEIKAKYPAGQFDSMVKQQGYTEQDVQNILKGQIVLEKAVAPQIHVSDADLKAYFDKNHQLFDKPEQVKARHILVADPNVAKQVLAKVKAGGNWDALAKQYSTDPSSKDKGGDLGYFGRGQMVPQFQDAAFGAKVGQIVGPVKSPFGYHIIQVVDKKPAQKATFASAHDQIKTTLTQQQQGQAAPAFVASLRQTAKIDVYDDRYKDAFPPPVPSPGAAASGAAAPASAAPASAGPASAAPAPAATK
ncbi:MAG: foldase protein PrsA [Candidatus Eremiobacteraeota bacterium]|jgi:foldase protein PrsA|nr:foldase protein PrsA [Candidatus Eremiobacteraeota bacterium]